MLYYKFESTNLYAEERLPLRLRTAIIPIGVSRFSLPSPLGEGLGVRLPPPLSGRSGGAFLFAKLINSKRESKNTLC